MTATTAPIPLPLVRRRNPITRSLRDAIAVSPETLRALLLHPLTDRGIDQFLTDLSRTHRTRVK